MHVPFLAGVLLSFHGQAPGARFSGCTSDLSRNRPTAKNYGNGMTAWNWLE